MGHKKKRYNLLKHNKNKETQQHKNKTQQHRIGTRRKRKF